MRFGGSGCCSSPAGVHSLTHTLTQTHAQTRLKTHTISLCPLHTRHPLSHPRQQDSRRTHTHTKEQTDAVTLEMQAKRCGGEKFSLKLENSLFISAFGLQEEFCLFVRFCFFFSPVFVVFLFFPSLFVPLLFGYSWT